MIAPHIAKWALNRQKPQSELRVDAGNATDVPNAYKKIKKPQVEERVLETKGGGGYVPPPQPSPMEQAQAREWEAAQEFEREQRRAAEDRAREDRAKEAKDLAWQSSRGAAYQGALSSGTDRLRSMGIEAGDPYGVYSQFTNRINTANQSLQPGADYSSAFAPTILDEILGGARSTQRNKYKTAFNAQVSPYYAEEQFGSTRDDPILASILNQQYEDALADLDAAKARGQANQSVYDRALRDLGTAKTTANTELQGIGGGVLSGISDAINKRRQTALDTAAGWDFGTDFDPTLEGSRIQKYAQERGNTLEGDIRSAIGDKQFFDVNSLLGKAQARVGNQTTPTTTGTGANALYDTFQDEAARNASTRSNEGIF